ncbi:hypothetical protein [Pseudogemmobacter sonorensis]|uniref:hypothetical protein n=1 Tax=Pseudogemmobacter sonorensis TaxID=2989681 RepID=UPI0036AD0006
MAVLGNPHRPGRDRGAGLHEDPGGAGRIGPGKARLRLDLRPFGKAMGVFRQEGIVEHRRRAGGAGGSSGGEDQLRHPRTAAMSPPRHGWK